MVVIVLVVGAAIMLVDAGEITLLVGCSCCAGA